MAVEVMVASDSGSGQRHDSGSKPSRDSVENLPPPFFITVAHEVPVGSRRRSPSRCLHQACFNTCASYGSDTLKTAF
ncbi:hypothetical protein L1887_29541 [Cichorium endivia]|nr:hypothetical protein L1887_29541 [Cichorium endivia]